MKKFMILGATLTQVPLVKKAKELGYHTIVASIPGNYPAFDVCDEKCFVDISKPEKVLEAAKELNIDGIATCCMDTPVRSVGYVCEHMNLVGLSEKPAVLCNNKYLMKEAFEKEGVMTPRFRKVSTRQELDKAMRELNFPLIVKAVDLQASRGIYVAKTIDSAISGFENAMNDTHQNFVIIEEFIEGEEFGAQAFIYDGQVQFVLPHGDITFFSHANLPIGHYAPLVESDDVLRLAEEAATKAIKAVGLNNCAVNIDMILKDGVVYMIELTGRAGATNLIELVAIYYGIDYYKMIVETAMGNDPRPIFNTKNEHFTANASKFIYSEHRGGILKEVVNHNDNTPELFDYSIFLKPGDVVTMFRDGKDRIGHIIMSGTDTPSCLAHLEEYINNIELVFED